MGNALRLSVSLIVVQRMKYNLYAALPVVCSMWVVLYAIIELVLKNTSATPLIYKRIKYLVSYDILEMCMEGILPFFDFVALRECMNCKEEEKDIADYCKGKHGGYTDCRPGHPWS